VLAYSTGLAGRGSSGYAGHNPLGGLVVLVMLLLVLAQAATGRFATDGDFYSGPRNDLISGRAGNQITEFHEVDFNVLLAIIALHVAAVLILSAFQAPESDRPHDYGLQGRSGPRPGADLRLQGAGRWRYADRRRGRRLPDGYGSVTTTQGA